MRSLLKPIGRLLLCLAILTLVSCLLQPPKDPPTTVEHYLSLAVPDSLADYDTVRVRLIREGDTVETLWNAPLPDTDSLQRLKTGTYDGGRMDVLIEGLRQGDIQYRVLVRLMGGGAPHEVERLPLPPDRIPPILTLNGPDSLRQLTGEAYEDSGATCRDLRDGDLDAMSEGTVPINAAGLHILVYRCADAAGNQADSAVRKVRIELPPDIVPPRITLRGEDSLVIHLGSDYVDSGATCRDGRDGDLEPTVEGLVKTDSLGMFTLTYRCADAAGNQAEAVSRRVRVMLPPDTVAPVISLTGEDTVAIALDSSFQEPGSRCEDDRDGPRPVIRSGLVDSSSPGLYMLRYDCEDGAGNQAATVGRAVKVEAPRDTTPAVLALKGASVIAIRAGGALADTGATCIHPARGALPVATEGKAVLDMPGVYTLRYACEVMPGRVDTVRQDVRVKPITVEIPILMEAEIDTFNNIHHNMGYNASGAFLPAEGDEHVILMRFDLSQVEVEGLKSAEAVFQTFGNGDWNGSPVTATLHVYRVQSAWTEGTGNWFWHYGGWRNGGATVFSQYPLSDSVKAKSTDPAEGIGVTGAQKSLVRKSNMISMGTRQVTVDFSAEESYRPVQAPFVPPKELLTPLSVDFTDYVKTVPADQDFGFVIVVEDLAPPMYISWLTKEAGDGSLGARLVLRY